MTMENNKLGQVIWNVLATLDEDEYLNGKTAAYWHIMAILDQHMVRDHDNYTKNLGDDND